MVKKFEEENTVGLFLNTLHIFADAKDTALCDKLAQMSLGGRYMERVESAEDADLETRIVTSPGCKWITLVSDCLEEEYEFTEELQEDIAKKLGLPALVIYDVDSDFVYLQLLEPDGRKLFASTGHDYERRTPVIEHPPRWEKYVSSIPAFYLAMRKKHVFAEECLYKAAPLLGMSVNQAICLMDTEREDCEVRHYYYRFPNYDPERNKPLLTYCRLPKCFVEGANTLEVQNEREASAGVTVEFSGPAIDSGKADITQLTLLDAETDKREEIAIERVTLQDGHTLLLANAPAFPLPKMQDSRLPGRIAEMRHLRVIYNVSVPGGEVLPAEYRMSVRIIPHKNPDGWCTRLMSMGTRENMGVCGPMVSHVGTIGF